MITIALVILGAAVAGILANRIMQPILDRAHEKHGVDLSKAESWASSALGPSVTLLALFLAFIIANVGASYSGAKKATETEAAVVENLSHTAAYLKDPFRERLQGATICYARAVAGPDWDAMRAGSDPSTVPAFWTGLGSEGMRRTFHDLGTGNSLFSDLTVTDQARADSRRTRLTEATPSVPGILIAFLVAVIAAVLVYHAVTSPPRSFLHVVATTVSVAALLGSMFLIYTLDRPYTGALRIDPTAMTSTARDLSADFVARYGAASLQCDASGKPTGAQTS